MRIPIATSLKTRTGAPATKDARIVNGYVESKGPANDPNNPPQTVVRKRPIAQGGIAIGTGTAQGGIGFNIGSTPYFVGFWGDTMQTYTGSGTNWSASGYYLIGDHVSVGFVDYWAVTEPNFNNNPTTSSSAWSRSYVTPPTRYTTSPSGASISVSIVLTGGAPFTTNQAWQVIRIAGGLVLSSGNGTWYQQTAVGISFSNYVMTAATAGTRRSADISIGITVGPIPAGYDYYIYNMNATWTGATYAGNGSFVPL